ncbi:MAG: hypothetical protein R3F19_15995 [Verrucomicrobiales bacterium]
MSTLLAIARQVENWRGRKRWEKAEGRDPRPGRFTHDWRTFIPEAVPDRRKRSDASGV